MIDGSRRRPVLGVLNIAGADAEREGDEGRNFFITFQGEAGASKPDSVTDAMGSGRRPVLGVRNTAGRGHSKTMEKLRYVKLLKT